MAPDGPTCADAVQALKGGAGAGENQIVARATTRYVRLVHFTQGDFRSPKT